MARKSDRDEPLEPPIPFRPTSNGEHAPRPLTRRDVLAEKMFYELADERARRLGIDRRRFLKTTAATATALLVAQRISGCASPSGTSDSGIDGGYPISDAMTYEDAAACEALSGDELIFDVQVHHVDTFDAETFIREVFINSDTSIACLSGVPGNSLDNDERLATREIVDRLAGSPRLIVHASVFPDRGEVELDAMARYSSEQAVGAWKVFPSTAGQWRFDDEAIGIALIDRARMLGKPRIAAHIGISGDSASYTDPSSPRPMAEVARAYPDVSFLAYHSGYEPGVVEGAYNADAPRGVDRLVRAVIDNGLAQTGNVYAELGSLWVYVMNDVAQAAHVLGKLLVNLGPDRILWGSDCIWHGSPRAQIEAFRAFQIPVEMQERFGYPALTPEIKRKIFGLNAAQVYGVDPEVVRCRIAEDDLASLRADAREQGRSIQRIYGPRTRREFFSLRRA
jgi:uncharacterized protein